jgi:hypothetical protein
MRVLVRNLIWLSGIIAVSAFIVLMGALIFPGAMKWTGSYVCPDDRPDTIVVRDTYQTQPGESSTNFTLYCLGPRGEFTDAGFAKPLFWLTVWFTGAMIVLTTLLRIWVRIRSGRADAGLPTAAEPAEPDGVNIIS